MSEPSSQDLSKEHLEAELQRLAPFHHDIELPHGLHTYDPEKGRRSIERTRIDNLVRLGFPPLLEAVGGSLEGKRVLDVACNCGGFSFQAAAMGAGEVLGFDVVDRYLEQADFIRRALAVDNVSFRQMTVDEVTPEAVGEFDVTFCFGIIYHLQDPLGAMRKLAAVTREAMLVDTAVLPFLPAPIWLQHAAPAADESAEDASTSLWRAEEVLQLRPTAKAITSLLKAVGFSRVERIRPRGRGFERRYFTGRRAAFLATR
jgi:2-polyprenyl-3-methyl-5-hydroxy-6-metoxy-1,4-benzoquinol methylase